jgi:hypothetical protein
MCVRRFTLLQGNTCEGITLITLVSEQNYESVSKEKESTDGIPCTGGGDEPSLYGKAAEDAGFYGGRGGR